MAIIRGPRPEDNYTSVPNDWLDDPRLSLKGKGILASILSHKEDYELTTEILVQRNRDGIDAVRTGLQELVDVGYLETWQDRRADGTWGETNFKLWPYDTMPVPGALQQVAAVMGKSRRGRDLQISKDSNGTVQGKSVHGESVRGKSGHGKPPHETSSLKEKTPPSPSPRKGKVTAPQARGEEEVQLPYTDEQLRDVEDQCVAASPHWRRRQVRQALADPRVLDRDPNIALIALLQLAEGRHGDTASPARLAGSGPWWSAAAREWRKSQRPLASVPRVSTPVIPAQPVASRECGDARCDGGFITSDTGGTGSLACPACKPGTHRQQLARARDNGHQVETLDDLLALHRDEASAA